MNTFLQKVKVIYQFSTESCSKLRTYILKTSYLPYCVCLFIGLLCFLCALKIDINEAKSLLLNISGSFISIPLLYYFYDKVKIFNDLNRKKPEYERLITEIHQELDIITNRLRLFIIPYSYRCNKRTDIQFLLSASSKQIERILKTFKYLGFKVHQEIGVDLEGISLIRNDRFFQTHFKQKHQDEFERLHSNLKVFMQYASPDLFEQLEKIGNCYDEQIIINQNSGLCKLTQHYLPGDKYEDEYRFNTDKIGYIRHCYRIKEEHINKIATIIYNIFLSIRILREI